jgi:peptidoglycan-binding protein ArfA
VTSTKHVLSLVAVSLLLALVGCGAAENARDSASVTPSTSTTSATTTAAAGGPFGAMSIVRTANGFTLTGELPDEATKTSLPDTIRQAMPGAKIVDDLTVKPGVTAPEFAGLGALFGAAVDIEGFGVNLVGDTATLTGTGDSDEVKAAAETAVTTTWPKVVVVNDIRVVPAGAGPACASRADVTDMLKTPITFATNGSALASGSQRLIAQIAEKVTACQGLKLGVVGYTDDTGGDVINAPLSASRAKAVADALISGGVARADVTSRGAGASNPVAGNDTQGGRAQNRRVEITVS